jgi:hypothetical protein
MQGGATSGFFGRLICHPLDTCKARIQAPPSFGYKVTSVWQVFKNTFASEGLAGLYRGIGVVTIGGVPGACMYFTSYEVSRRRVAYLTDNNNCHCLFRRDVTLFYCPYFYIYIVLKGSAVRSQ